MFKSILHQILFLFALAMPLMACRMLGVIALPGESLSTTFGSGEYHPFLMEELEAFRLQGGSGGWPYNNRDGWAMTGYHLNLDIINAQTVRSDIEAYSDVDYYYSTSTLLVADQVPLILGHLRQTSSGATGIDNPHPFIFTAENGDIYSFAHNGDVGKEELRALIGDEWLSQNPPQTFGGGPWDGSGWNDIVDSELFFFWIVQNIQETGSVLDGIQQALVVLEEQQPFQLKNFLFSDGRDLYGYRRSSLPDIHYFDASNAEDLPPYLSGSNHRVIMSTPPSDGTSSDLPWIELPDRTLLVFREDGSTELFEDFLTMDIDIAANQPERAGLNLAYPNPFNASTLIPLQTFEHGYYKLNIYNPRGQRVYSDGKLLNEGVSYRFVWTGQDLTGNPLDSGSYFFRVTHGSKLISAGKLLLLK